MTSHYMDEVQHLADRALVLARGRVVAEGSPASLGGAGSRETLISFRLPDRLAIDQLPAQLRRRMTSGDGVLTIRTGEPTSVLSDLCGWAAARDLELDGLEVVHPSLEEVYLQLTAEGRNGSD